MILCFSLLRRTTRSNMNHTRRLGRFGATARWPLSLFLCSLVFVLAACGNAGNTPATSPPTATLAPTATTSGATGDFVGTVPDLDAGIAISTDGQNVIVYLSDGTPTHITYAAWFQGQLTNNTFNLDNISTVEITGLVSASSVTGTVTLQDGSNHTFSASPVATGNQAGLYRAELNDGGVDYLGGWFILNSGEATDGTPSEGGGVLDEQTDTPFTAPTPNFTQKTVTVTGIGTFTLHYCHLAQCA